MEIILVVGATGAEGGSVARHLLARGRFRVRCLSRDPVGAAAENLRRSGAEVVPGDLDDADSVGRALDGCSGLFGMTSYWEHFDREVEQGRRLADMAAGAGLGFAIFSTLPSAAELSGGALEVPLYDQKAQIAEHVRALGLPACFVHVALHYETFLGPLAPRRQPDGTCVLGLPQGDRPLAMVAAADVGGLVARLFEEPAAWIGRSLGIVGDERPVAGYAEIMARVTGRPVVYRHLPHDLFAAFGTPLGADLADLFELTRRFGPSRADDVVQTRTLFPDLQDFAAWAAAHRAELLAALEPPARPAGG